MKKNLARLFLSIALVVFAIAVQPSIALANIDGSRVTFNGGMLCYEPGPARTCIKIYNGSSDGEGIDKVRVDLPDGWEITGYACDGVDDLGNTVFINSNICSVDGDIFECGS